MDGSAKEVQSYRLDGRCGALRNEIRQLGSLRAMSSVPLRELKMEEKKCATGTCEISDEEVVERIRSGDTTLYGVLMSRHHRHLYRVARNILENDAEAEDALQEAHMRVLTHLDQFAGRSSFATWMTRITMNEAFTYIRRRPRHEALETVSLPPGKMKTFFASRTPNPEQQALFAEQCNMLGAAVQALPKKHRALLVMRTTDEMSVAEAAQRLGITEECAKTRLHRARALLRQQITEQQRALAPAA
jgi:RNA polymerase sigma-70 factor (ECF subfamily)